MIITATTNFFPLQEPPRTTTNGQIIEYSVYLAMRSASLAQPAFVPVYIGPTPNCVVGCMHWK